MESHYHSFGIVPRIHLSCKHISSEGAHCFKFFGAIIQEISWGHFPRVPWGLSPKTRPLGPLVLGIPPIHWFQYISKRAPQYNSFQCAPLSISIESKQYHQINLHVMTNCIVCSLSASSSNIMAMGFSMSLGDMLLDHDTTPYSAYKNCRTDTGVSVCCTVSLNSNVHGQAMDNIIHRLYAPPLVLSRVHILTE